MLAFGTVVNFLIWISIAIIWWRRDGVVLAGARGEPKGRSFIGYFLLSLLFFPLTLILAYMSTKRAAPLASYTAPRCHRPEISHFRSRAT